MITDNSVTHDTFTIQRTYTASPALVFAAFADPKAKARWAGSPGSVADGDAEGYIEFDFRLGGHERFGFEMPGDAGTALTYTEQGAFLDGLDQPELRLEGTTELLDSLAAHLASHTAE